MPMEFHGQAKLDPLGESFQDPGFVGHAGCVAGLEPRTSPPMTNARKPKRPTKYSRTNGIPPESRPDGPLTWDGPSYASGIPLSLSRVESVEIWNSRYDRFGHISSVVTAALALSPMPSTLDGVDSRSSNSFGEELADEPVEHHDYRLSNGYAHSEYLPERGHLIVVSGMTSIEQSRRVADLAVRTPNHGHLDVLPRLVTWPGPSETMLKMIIHMALHNHPYVGIDPCCADELLPLFRREQKNEPDGRLLPLLERAISTYRRVHRRDNPVRGFSNRALGC
jgi:hypothetical protein